MNANAAVNEIGAEPQQPPKTGGPYTPAEHRCEMSTGEWWRRRDAGVVAATEEMLQDRGRLCAREAAPAQAQEGRHETHYRISAQKRSAWKS
jgi:hypothetical protein